MIRTQTTIINKLGLHARAATKFANTANQFASDIEVVCNGRAVDGKSIMSLMLLAAAKGTEIELATDGEDQDQAMQALLDLIADKFGEES
jgi:phosphocarrier protein HPr